ncbi:dnaJ homolog subfamily C member 9 isoform X1 [Loxodonta africana]|uniref:dnaJ homolog subfamily C member 9 isoform X1 n=1 Tax=Loxodonta africana TaxID=9785 RepID=UPI0030D5EC27
MLDFCVKNWQFHSFNLVRRSRYGVSSRAGLWREGRRRAFPGRGRVWRAPGYSCFRCGRRFERPLRAGRQTGDAGSAPGSAPYPALQIVSGCRKACPAPSRASCDAGALGFLRGKRKRPRLQLRARGQPPAAVPCPPWGCWSCARRCSAPPTCTGCWASGARLLRARSDAATAGCPCRCTRTGWERATRRTPPAASRCASAHPRRTRRPVFGPRGPARGILGRVYSVLSDREQRAVYDEQGTVDEDSAALSPDRDWETYWRLLFKKISLEDIQAFEKTYKGSEEELADIKQAYLDFKGDMDQIMASVLCVEYTEEPRIRNIIQQAIDTGEVPAYKAFVKESKQKMNARKRRAQEEAKEAERSRKELGLSEGVDNLKVAIQSRQKDRQKEMDNFLAQMEAKYCKPSKGGGKKTSLKKEKK